VAALLAATGCTTTVAPPAEIAEPARIALLDHGRHASLVLETTDGGLVRYAYGDWRWYALRQTGFVDGVAALLWPTQGTLGRRELPGPLDPATVSEQVRVPIESAIYFDVEAAHADHLRAHLEQIYQANLETRADGFAFDLVFVHHPEPYGMLHNSNQMVGHWLSELGCRVGGFALFSDWAVAS
jgi:hypothetical protein